MTEKRCKEISAMTMAEYMALDKNEIAEYMAYLVEKSNQHFAEYMEMQKETVNSTTMSYLEQFEEHYKDWFEGMHIKRLVECEQNLSAFIDSDLYQHFVLGDEVEILYRLVRDECVHRCSIRAESSDELY